MDAADLLELDGAFRESRLAADGLVVTTVDSHTCGEPTRVVVGGLELDGATVLEKRSSMAAKYDHVRLFLTREPRGHRDMFAAVATAPESDGAAFGLVFMDARRYPLMCGHGTIGAVTTFVNLGRVEAARRAGPGGRCEVVVDTPSGPIRAAVRLDDRGRAAEVTLRMVPAFVYETERPLRVGELQLVADLVCVGGFFVMVDAAQLLPGLEMTSARAKEITDLGMRVIAAANQQLRVQHPLLPHVNTVDVVEFHSAGSSAVVYGEHHLDRSPCGTGTAAKMALMHRRGKLRLGDEVTNRGVLGTEFRGRLVEETKVGDLDAVVSEITGAAHLTGLHRFVVSPDDPFPRGFLFGAAE